MVLTFPAIYTKENVENDMAVSVSFIANSRFGERIRSDSNRF